MPRLLLLPLLLLGFAASAQTVTPTSENPRIGLGKSSGSVGSTTGIHAKPTPLYIVDGQTIDAFQLSDIKPDQIQSVDVLKGNAAIVRYGDKAKGGAILITTKASAISK